MRLGLDCYSRRASQAEKKRFFTLTKAGIWLIIIDAFTAPDLALRMLFFSCLARMLASFTLRILSAADLADELSYSRKTLLWRKFLPPLIFSPSFCGQLQSRNSSGMASTFAVNSIPHLYRTIIWLIFLLPSYLRTLLY